MDSSWSATACLHSVAPLRGTSQGHNAPACWLLETAADRLMKKPDYGSTCVVVCQMATVVIVLVRQIHDSSGMLPVKRCRLRAQPVITALAFGCMTGLSMAMQRVPTGRALLDTECVHYIILRPVCRHGCTWWQSVIGLLCTESDKCTPAGVSQADHTGCPRETAVHFQRLSPPVRLLFTLLHALQHRGHVQQMPGHCGAP